MIREHAGADELHSLVDEKLTALVRELEEANWSAGQIAHAIEDILKTKWLKAEEALRDARESVPRNYVSDGNEG
jgi:hypothetical protein